MNLFGLSQNLAMPETSLNEIQKMGGSKKD